MKKTTTTKKATAKAAAKPAKKITIAQVAPAQAVAGLGDSLTIRISAEVKAELRLRALAEGHGKMSRVAQAVLAQALGL